jgi:hypothetical protein
MIVVTIEISVPQPEDALTVAAAISDLLTAGSGVRGSGVVHAFRVEQDDA